MTLFDFILSLLLVFNPMPESTFDQVYSLLDDTQLRTVLVEDSAVEALSQLAGDVGIMPLEFTDKDSVVLNNIFKMLYTGTSDSVAYWARQINQNVVNFRNDFLGFPDLFEEHARVTSKIYDFLISINEYSGLVGLLRSSNKNTEFTWKYLDQITGQLTDFALSNSGGWDVLYDVLLFTLADFSWSDGKTTPFVLLAELRNFFLNASYIPAGSVVLDGAGNLSVLTGPQSFSLALSDAFVGISRLMSGEDRLTTFSFLKEDLSSAEDVTANNLFDALGLVGTQLQNPLQRLAYVLANPQDIQIREDVSGNVDQAQEDFFKPEGGGSVKPSDIKDAAGISGGAADALQSPGSVGDLTAQINNQDNFSFFSETTLGNLDSVPSTFSEGDEDFIDFYDPSNPALWEALKHEPVS